MPDISEFVANAVTVDVPLVTTAETVVITSDPVVVPREDAIVVIIAWSQLNVGTTTTGVVPRIRRGAAATGQQLGDTVTEAVKGAAGSTEPFFMITTDFQSGVGSVQYSFTLTQNGATANGTSVQAGILVLVF